MIEKKIRRDSEKRVRWNKESEPCQAIEILKRDLRNTQYYWIHIRELGTEIMIDFACI